MLTSRYARPGPRRWLRTLVLLLVVGGSFAVLNANAKAPRDLSAFDRLVLNLSAPIQAAMSSGWHRATGVWDHYLALVSVREENTLLENKVILLEYRLQVLRELELENQRLRRLLDFTRQQDRPFRTARVVGYDPTSHYRTLRIDRGMSGGVAPGMAVATDQGVVGKVLRAWTNYADVLLVTDARSGVDCLIQRTRARGTVEGGGSDNLRMKYLLRLDEVQEGDLVITSGFDGVYPAGLLVGTVSGVRKQSSGVFQEVQILPVVDLSRVEEILVLEPPPQASGTLVGPPAPPRETAP